MKNKFRIFVFIIMVCLFSNLKVKAVFPNTLGTLYGTDVNPDLRREVGKFGTSVKISESEGLKTPALCVNHADRSPADNKTQCNLITDSRAWNDQVSAGIAAIIKLAKPEINTEKITDAAFYASYAINQFLYDKNSGGQDVRNLEPELANNQYYLNYMSAAKTAYDNAKEPTVSLSNKNLTFSLKDNEYVSNAITVTSDTNYDKNVKVFINDNEKNDVNVKINNLGDDKYTISIPLESIVVGENIKIDFNVTANKTIEQAKKYSCGTYIDEEDYNANGNKSETLNFQDVTPVLYENKTLSKSVSVSGNISVSASLTIKKTDENKKILPGVELKIESKENNYSKTIITTDKEIVLEDLQLGKYTITEISTPAGYVKLGKPVEVTLSHKKLNEVVTLNNKLTRVEISKINSVDSKLLPGAVLQIQDKDGNVLKDENDEKYEWTSTDEVHVITGLPKGIYYLVEISAPEGYELNEEKVKFEVDEEKSVVKVEMENNIEVKVPDTLSSRSALLITISMFDIFLGIGIITYVKKSKIQE